MALKIALILAAYVNFGVHGVLRLPNYYSNHMVLQRAPERAILWGYADVIGDTVRILKNDVQVAVTIVQRSTTNTTLGIWKVKLPAESKPGPFAIQINSTEGNLTLVDVMFGDVWVCSGQSNMEFRMRQVHDSAYEINDSLQYNDIRMIYTTLLKSNVTLGDVTVAYPWTYPKIGFIDYFSAVCFMFARDLQKHLNIPIGLVESNWGGTPIEFWSSPSALNGCPNSVPLNTNEWWPSALWNSMIHPYLPMTIKGAIWYQGCSTDPKHLGYTGSACQVGEANAAHPDLYACQFPTMINDWRKKFNAASEGETSENFPFGFVQLAPWRAGDSIIQGFPPTRWAQTTDVGYVPNSNMPNTFMAVAVDLPDFNSTAGAIHPTYKQDIAARLALGARNVAYGEHDVTFQGPFPTAYTMNPGQKTLDITFDNGTGSLQMKNNKGFEICCAYTLSGCSYPTAWQAAPIKTSVQSKIEIDVSGCHGNYHIAGVRYLWRESPCALKQCALYDSQSHLPVPPFIKTEIFKSAESVLVG